VSLRKASQYRTEKDEQYDIAAYKKKAADLAKKKKVLSSVYGDKKGKDEAPDVEIGDAIKECVGLMHLHLCGILHCRQTNETESNKRKRRRGKSRGRRQTGENDDETANETTSTVATPSDSKRTKGCLYFFIFIYLNYS
jgi:hypothetical protein